MATLKLSNFLRGVAGREGNAGDRYTRNGTELRHRPFVNNPQTAAQQAVRGAFSKATKGWRSLTTAQAAANRTIQLVSGRLQMQMWTIVSWTRVRTQRTTVGCDVAKNKLSVGTFTIFQGTPRYFTHGQCVRSAVSNFRYASGFIDDQ